MAYMRASQVSPVAPEGIAPTAASPVALRPSVRASASATFQRVSLSASARLAPTNPPPTTRMSVLIVMQAIVVAHHSRHGAGWRNSGTNAWQCEGDTPLALPLHQMPLTIIPLGAHHPTIPQSHNPAFP